MWNVRPDNFIQYQLNQGAKNSGAYELWNQKPKAKLDVSVQQEVKGIYWLLTCTNNYLALLIPLEAQLDNLACKIQTNKTKQKKTSIHNSQYVYVGSNWTKDWANKTRCKKKKSLGFSPRFRFDVLTWGAAPDLWNVANRCWSQL
jgi:hypothetical protein